MKMETTARSLASALHIAKGVVRRRNSIPVLSAVKLSDGRLSAMGGVDMRVEVALPTVGKSRGATAIDCHSLAGLLAHIPGDEAIEITDGHSLAAIKFNGSEYQLPSYAASDFPTMLEKIDGHRTALDNVGFIAAIKRVMFAASTDEFRYYLNGVATVYLNGEPAVVATDGRRLAWMPIPFIPDGAEGAILPSEAVAFLVKRRLEPKAAVFSTDSLSARFEYDGLVFSTKCIDGTYPDIARALPEPPAPYARLDRREAVAALLRLSSLDALGNDCAVILTGADGRVSITRDGGAYSGRETLSCKTFDTGGFKVGFNGRYLLDVLSALSGDAVTLSSEAGGSGLSPSIFASDDDPLHTVLMPMRI
ncbi:DNA polymerase III subunit beta [Nitratireductor sp. StC3]|uniref:DNA polymerase III subunit beta n=1 Tax=Nitratireductor sp. StC3 TaxID=2126741 RepID=UPI000D0D0761|nr:DNA polymerase III subunit beta [Nitratireductor sp. StC3]PSM18243.1 DNA polymerase III subunit beta [Nitratireductor sp. StC3]